MMHVSIVCKSIINWQKTVCASTKTIVFILAALPFSSIGKSFDIVQCRHQRLFQKRLNFAAHTTQIETQLARRDISFFPVLRPRSSTKLT